MATAYSHMTKCSASSSTESILKFARGMVGSMQDRLISKFLRSSHRSVFVWYMMTLRSPGSFVSSSESISMFGRMPWPSLPRLSATSCSIHRPSTRPRFGVRNENLLRPCR